MAAALLLLLTANWAAADDACLGREGQVCDGCHTVVVCNGTGPAAVGGQTCPPATPYCSGGVCVERMAAENPCQVTPRPSAANFRCPSDDFIGQLPDPFDCTRYHVCRRGAAWTYTCDVAPGTVYRHASGRCEPPALAPCTSITCSGDGDDRLQLYGPDNSVGFRCEGAGNATAILCPANHRVDVGGSADSPACVRYCPRDGRQPVANDKSLYYECLALPDGSLSRPVLRECPEGSVFDADEERCRVLQDS